MTKEEYKKKLKDIISYSWSDINIDDFFKNIIIEDKEFINILNNNYDKNTWYSNLNLLDIIIPIVQNNINFFKRNYIYLYKSLRKYIKFSGSTFDYENLKNIFKYLNEKKVDKQKLYNCFKNVYSWRYRRISALLNIIYNSFTDEEKIELIVYKIKCKRLDHFGIYDRTIKWELLKPHITANLFTLKYIKELNFKSYKDIGLFYSKYIFNDRYESRWLKRKLEREQLEANANKQTL